LFYIPAAVIYVIVKMTPKTGSFRAGLDRVAVKFPVLGQAVYRLSVSRYCWVFHMLCKAGVPIVSCAKKSALVAGNALVAEQVGGGGASAKAGNLVSEGFGSGLPLDFLDIWRVGEETGKLEEVSKRLADNYGESAEMWFGEFASWFPRLVYGLVCGVIICHILWNFSQIISAAF
jgi:type II secretory pathway component PulF